MRKTIAAHTQEFIDIYKRNLTTHGISDISMQVALIAILQETMLEWADNYKKYRGA